MNKQIRNNRNNIDQSNAEPNRWPDIFLASRNGDLESVKYFIEAKNIDVNSRLTGSGETPLHKASQGGHFEVVKYLVSKKADVNNKDKWGYNALLWAVDNNETKLDVIEFLIEKGSDKSVADNKNAYTAIHWAAFHGRLDIVKYLIEKGVDANAKTVKGDTALLLAANKGHSDVVAFLIDEKNVAYNGDIFDAASSGYLGIVKYFIEKKGALPDIRDRENNSALHIAARDGKLPVVQYLIEKQFLNVNLQGKDNWTPLIMASSSGHLNVVQYLADENEADVEAKDVIGKPALLVAAQFGKLNIVAYLIDTKNVDTTVIDTLPSVLANVLLYAAASGSVPLCKYLIEQKNFDIQVKDAHENGILHEAAQHDKIDAVRYFVENLKVDLNPKNDFGQTPLTFAVNKSLFIIIDYLLKRGANIEVKDLAGSNLLHYAAAGGKVESMRYLLDKYNFDINGVNYWNETPLYFACLFGFVNAAKYLIDEKKADMYIKSNTKSNTILHRAMHNLDLVKYLVGVKNFDTNIVNDDGQTVLMMAAENGKLDIVQYLLEERKMNEKILDKNGNNVLHRAADHGHLDIVKYLIEKIRMDPLLKNKNGQNSMQLASTNNHTLVVKFLETKTSNATSDSNKNPSNFKKRRQSRQFLHETSPTDRANAISNNQGLLGDNEDIANSGDLSFGNLDSAITLMDLGIRYLSGNKFDQPKHETLRSKEEIIESKIDKNAVDAIQSTTYYESNE